MLHSNVGKRCGECGRHDFLPINCGDCGGSFCPTHLFPDAHSCDRSKVVSASESISASPKLHMSRDKVISGSRKPTNQAAQPSSSKKRKRKGDMTPVRPSATGSDARTPRVSDQAKASEPSRKRGKREAESSGSDGKKVKKPGHVLYLGAPPESMPGCNLTAREYGMRTGRRLKSKQERSRTPSPKRVRQRTPSPSRRAPPPNVDTTSVRPSATGSDARTPRVSDQAKASEPSRKRGKREAESSGSDGKKVKKPGHVLYLGAPPESMPGCNLTAREYGMRTGRRLKSKQERSRTPSPKRVRRRTPSPSRCAPLPNVDSRSPRQREGRRQEYRLSDGKNTSEEEKRGSLLAAALGPADPLGLPDPAGRWGLKKGEAVAVLVLIIFYVALFFYRYWPAFGRRVLSNES